jgi:hypothetical protein
MEAMLGSGADKMSYMGDMVELFQMQDYVVDSKQISQNSIEILIEQGFEDLPVRFVVEFLRSEYGLGHAIIYVDVEGDLVNINPDDIIGAVSLIGGANSDYQYILYDIIDYIT